MVKPSLHICIMSYSGHIHINLYLCVSTSFSLRGHTMAEVISYWPVTMEVQIQSQSSHVRIVVDRVALGQVFV